ncbi:MAG TPA: nuclear transport factor 2 family protein [Clostridia bacterium]|nr:nuclear transport factor 2 family protein [Clostridia bacterium]
MTTLTPETVRAEIEKFWNAFTSKSAEALEEFYAHESSVFGSTATRPEPGRLAATRRKREYFTANSQLRSQVGLIDIVMLGDTAAVASYTFQFHASRIATATAKSSDEHILHGRATQVFAVDHDGSIRIFHEHFSLPYTA